jgi:hypothetical protein
VKGNRAGVDQWETMSRKTVRPNILSKGDKENFVKEEMQEEGWMIHGFTPRPFNQ